MGGRTRQTLTETSLICTREFIGAHTGHCPLAGGTYRRRMANNGRSASPPSRTRSSRQRWWRSSRRSTRRSSWGSATGSGLGVASMMRWMRSRTESRHAKSTGSSTPTFALLRFFEPGMARKICRMPNWRSTDHSPDPEMVEGGCAGRGPLDRDDGGYPAGFSGIATACKRVPPLCLRSLGPAVAQAPCARRYDRRAVCRRYDRWLPAPA